MGIIKNNLTLSRFSVEGKVNNNFNDFIDKMIKRFAFNSKLKLDNIYSGWTSFQDILDTNFLFTNYSIGNYFIFSIRMDKKKIPYSLLKIKFLEEEKKILYKTNKKFLNKNFKKDLKEKIKLELNNLIPSIPLFFDVCWLPQDNIVYFFSLSSLPILEFKALFKRSFNMDLNFFYPWKKIINFDFKKNKKIGRDFIVWLWFKTEKNNNFINLPNYHDNIEVIFIKRVVFESEKGDFSETIVYQNSNTKIKDNENREKVLKGRKIKEARIRISIDDFSWEFTFKADLFQIQSMIFSKNQNIINIKTIKNCENLLLERIFLLKKIFTIIDDLFLVFYQENFSEKII